MNLEIKDFYSPDIDNIWQWEPSDPEEVLFLLETSIGEKGNVKSDIFQVMIATPDGLKSTALSEEFILSDRACLVIKEYSWKKVLKELNDIVEKCASDTWSDSVIKLQRYFHWEYEDYVMDE